MLTLFNEYKGAGKISEAILIGRNLFNRHPSNQEVFAAYFDFLCSLAESLPSVSDRRDFAEQAAVTIAFYTENAEISDDVIAEIGKYQQRLSDVVNAIYETEQIQAQTALAAAEANNSDCLKKLYKLKDTLHSATSQEKFDATLADVGTVDGEIDKDSLTAEQNKVYETLTKELTDVISSKMRDLEYKRNTAYNKEAAVSFSKAFKLFREDEGKYKNQTQLFKLASTTLFAYDASRLFNETLIYYNHVYSYIFSKLDDDGKLALTRFSIECERKLR